jgi:biopolymer transport protein ExbD
MPLHQTQRRSRLDPTIGLVDIVFLLVMFFLLAGTIARPLGADVTLIRNAGQDPVPPPDALVLLADGTLRFRGSLTDPLTFVTALPQDDRGVVRIVPDADVSATLLVATARALGKAGAGEVVIVTERKVP